MAKTRRGGHSCSQAVAAGNRLKSGERYQWSADDGKITLKSTGAMLTLQNALPPGPHTVRVTVTNGLGLTSQASIHVVVLTPDGKVAGSNGLPQLPFWLILVFGGVVVIVLIVVVLALVRRQKRRKAKAAA